MKRKRRMIALVVLILLLLIGSMPRLYGQETVDVTHIAEYPALQEAYQRLCEDHSLYEIQTEDTIQIVTVKNLWGSWKRYILPCYLAEVPDVPGDRMADCNVALHILSPWSEVNFFTERCRLKVLDYTQRIEPGENTVLYEDAEFTWPQLAPARYQVHAPSFSSDTAFICDDLPTAHTNFSLAANSRELEPSQPVTTTIYFDYTLRMLGRQIYACDYELSCEHLVNG